MARPLRIEYPGAWYHVMNRGLRRFRIYTKKEDYQLFLNALSESCSLFNVSISSYCLMPNHYHILVCTPEGNLSRFMRHLNGVYTQRHNRKHKIDGPLFRGRYKSILVQDDEYLKQVVRYIHLNPIEAKVANSLSDYKWSSHIYYVKGKSKEEHIDINSVLSQFSLKRKEAIKAYKEFMESRIDEKTRRFYSRKNQGSILGEKSFIRKIKEEYVYSDKSSNLEIKEKRNIQGEGKISIINKAIRKTLNVEEQSLYRSRRGEENNARLMAISLARELTGLSFSEIALKYHVLSYRTVGTSCYRLKQKIKENNKLAKIYKNLKLNCNQEWI